MFTNEEQARAHVEKLMEQGRAHARDAQQMSVEMDALRVTGWSPDRSASVTLSQSGALVDLALTEKLRESTLVQIRAAVLAANGDAARRLAEEVAVLADRFYGEGSQTARELSRQWSSMLAPAATEPGETAAGRSGTGSRR